MTKTTFTIDNDGGVSKKFTVDIRLPEAGDLYRINNVFRTIAKCEYSEGDTLEIICRTQERYNLINSLGNLKVKCKFFPAYSFWTGIELMIESKQLTLTSTTLDKGDTWLEVQARQIEVN